MTSMNTAGLPERGCGHAVQFYESEAFLGSAVADFLAEGLLAGERALVIATRPHWELLTARLGALGIEADAAGVSFLDAAEVLATFMRDGQPDPSLFRASVGSAIECAAGGHGRPRIRAFGEMVDLLWRENQIDAALHLEQLWNELAAEHSFSLLCAYSIGNFYSETHSESFRRVCDQHSRVVPAEPLVEGGGEDGRLREIALLQQRAKALENEVVHRMELERALRDALADRRRAEETALRSERDLEDFVENAAIGIHRVGADGIILWANRAESTLLGYAREEYVGRNIAGFHADPETIRDILDRLKANEEIREFEADLIAKDGSIRHVIVNSNAHFENGRFVHTRCFTRDVTEEKRLQAANAFLLDATTILNGSLDYEARLAEIPKLAVPRLGDWCAVDIVREDDRSERAAAFPASEITAVPDPAIVAEVLRTGESRLAEWWAVLPMKSGERILGALSLAFQASSRRRDADIPLATEFARRAAIAIDNARLYHLAQEANRTKDEFLATLSHELRTPLTAILGWARMLMLGSLDAETSRTAVETIERSARTQASIIDDLLDLSRIVTGKLTLRRELVDLGEVIDSTVQTLRLAAEAKSIHLDVASCERLVVTGDGTRLQQIAWNLLANAIKFSRPESEVSIALERKADHARIVVRDNGRGITPEFLPHVFEPFLQAERTSTRVHGGLGLGLAIVKYLTELHGGTVSAASEGTNLGATFTVRLPLALRNSKRQIPIEDDLVDLGGRVILVVDDDADTRAIIVAMLRRCGAEVHASASVDAAREALQRLTPDVLVTDIAMPEEDGLTLLKHIRAHEAGSKRIPIVAVTAFGREDEESRLRAEGFDAYVRKPLDPLHFARVIARVQGVGASVLSFSTSSGVGDSTACGETEN
jgi:PAS domain S-box-containing protein